MGGAAHRQASTGQLARAVGLRSYEAKGLPLRNDTVLHVSSSIAIQQTASSCLRTACTGTGVLLPSLSHGPASLVFED